MNTNKVRAIMLAATILVVGGIGVFSSYYARGYRIDPKTLRWTPNGLLVIKSDPEAAQVFIDKKLKTAANTTISLAPGTYLIEVKKDGYYTWKKEIKIDKEVVTQIDASLFKSAPNLSAITFFSSLVPSASQDFTKIVYQVPENLTDNDKSGLWIIETLNLPLGFSRDPRRITDGDLSQSTWELSPDSRELLLYTKPNYYLLDTNTFTPESKRTILNKADLTQNQWQNEASLKLASSIKNVPDELAEVLNQKTSNVIFSPDQDMVLYTASDSATLPEKLISQLPGASTQRQERDIKKDRTYVYDIKEDRNFLIDDNTKDLVLGNGKVTPSTKRRIAWFPTSRHLVLAESGKISIMDYDGTNRQTVYTGSYFAPNAFPTLSKDRIIILTNLGANSALPNLFSLSVK